MEPIFKRVIKMTFELLLNDEDTKLLGSVISVISGIVSECRLHIVESGIRIRAFDPTRISLIDFFLKSDIFEKYSVKEDSFIGVSLETLNTILKTAKKGEELQLTFDDATKRFQVSFRAKGKNRSFSLMILELEEDESLPDDINFPFDVSFSIDAGFLQQVLKDASMISDYLKINAAEDKITFNAASSTKEMNTVVNPESEEIEDDTFSVKEESQSIYSLEFLTNFMKGIRSSDKVLISFSKEQPIRIINDLEGKGHLIYLVAPRIEETDDLVGDESEDMNFDTNDDY